MSKWAKILGALGVLVIAGAVSVAALLSQYDYNQLKPMIAKMVKDATGRDLTINGDLDLAVSLSPTLNVSDLTLANAPWGEKGDMVRLDQLAAKVDLMALLQGRIDIDYLVLDGLTVVLQTDGKGRANWEFEAPGAVAAAATSDGSLLFVPSARDVRLQDVDVTYIDGATGKRLHVVLERADFKADSFSSPIRASLVAAYQGVDVDAVVNMGSLSQLVHKEGPAFPVAMDISAAGLRAMLKGTVDQPQAGLGIKAHLELAVSDSATLDQLAGTPLPNLDGLKINMNIDGGGPQYAFSAIEARVGDSDLGGDITVSLAGVRPSLSGKLTAKVLDLDQILGIETPAPKFGSKSATLSDGSGPEVATVTPEGEAPIVFSNEALPFDVLRLADADIGVLVARLKIMSLTVDALKAGVKLKGGMLDLKPVSLSLEGGEVEGVLHLDGAAKAPTLRLTSKLSHLDVGRVLKSVGMGDMLTLPVDGTVDVNAKGSSLHDWMAGLNGAVRLGGRDGRINDASITKMTSGMGSIMPWAQHKDASEITCMVADWPMDKGIVTAKAVLVDMPGFSVAVTGNIDLGGERLHLTVSPKAKTTSLASFAVPVRIKGALGAPYVGVDAGEAVVGTVGNIVKAPVSILSTILGVDGKLSADDPCVKALSGGKTAPETPKESPKESPASAAPSDTKKPADVLAPVEDLGRALKGLLGK